MHQVVYVGELPAQVQAMLLRLRGATLGVPPLRDRTTLEAAVRDAEHAAITAALAALAGNLSQTARALGIERNTLKRKLARLGLSPRR